MTDVPANVVAWIRDESALCAALIEDEQSASHREALRHFGDVESEFDARTSILLRDRAEDLLETLELVLGDDALWAALEHQASTTPDAEQIERVRALGRADLAALLHFAGYREPPPPPVTQRVDALQAALSRAASRPNDGGASIQAAKYELGATLWRARKQIVRRELGSDEDGGQLRVAVRTLLRGVEYVGPILIGAKVTLITGSLDLGLAATTGVELIKRILADGLQLGVEVVRGWIGLDNDGEPPLEPEGPWPDGAHGVEPVRAHAVAIVELLHSDDESVETLRLLRRHTRRLGQLLMDEGAQGAIAMSDAEQGTNLRQLASNLVDLADTALQGRS